ncbi:MAG: prolyl oligopeptidase family serine peptidase [Lewinellaceae bacterium]|nr:prolyl oligopeptidase family serine peptidase [Phaeodactylibacter sp.]MCB9038839.1 prolyl oligopeptidase family serine peptidase [Lewinellaceae bacterium]
MQKSGILLLLFLNLYFPLLAQPLNNNSPLTIGQIMQGEDFVGYLPEDIRWSEDSRTIYFSWKQAEDNLRGPCQVAVGGGKAPQPLTLEEEKTLPENGDYNRDRSLKVYEKNGDLFLLETANGNIKQLTNTVGEEGSPRFSGDGSKIVYAFDSNLYAWDRASGATEQLTDFRKGSKKEEPALPEYQQWLKQDQMELFGVLRERQVEKDRKKAHREALQPKRPLEIYYGNKRLSNLQASPGLRFVTFQLTADADAQNTMVPAFVTETGYVEEQRARPKVGSPQDTYELGVYDRQRDTFFTVETKNLEGISGKPAFLYEYHKDSLPFHSNYDAPKPVRILGPIFSEGGQAAVVVRSYDNKDRWIATLNLEQGTLNQLDRQHDEAWIGGPGIVRWDGETGTLGWLNEELLYFQSEATGFSHLYTVNVNTGEKRALTNGAYEVLGVQLSRDKRFFYLAANAEGPHEQHFYRLPAVGGKLEKITSLPGRHEASLSPDERHLAIRYSYSNQPWELYLMENKAGAKMERLTKSTTEAFNRYSWRDPEIVNFTARDGAKVPARLYRPENAPPGGPAVIFVHGAGYLQNAHRWWSSYFREYMFHNLLADNGYTVLDIDYRGSAGYGRNWRTAIYRHMGGKDLDDQVDGAAYLAKELGAGPQRIGIYGGSYGGFITLMALFTSPGTFKAGAALRSVADWAHYNHGYTSDILNTPVEDSLAYRRSSPIYFAEGLEDRLLILHGMVDDNVQFQDVARLAQRLIELGKDNWELAVFPVEAHGFVEPSSWTDEYRRIFKLFEEELK